MASPCPEEIRAQLDRILADGAFTHSERASRFLRYVVERSLAGEADALKEYAIGIDVFDRGAEYDPRLDSIVRVEAGRLRSRVEEYYNGPGRADAVRIRLRRGSYAPAFELVDQGNEAQPAPVTQVSPAAGSPRPRVVVGLACGLLVLTVLIAWRGAVWPSVSSSTPVRIAVLPLASYSTDETDQRLADRITDGVTTELARLRTLGVVSRTSALQFADRRTSAPEIGRALNAAVLLEGTVTIEQDRVRVNARLVRTDSDRKFWVDDFSGTVSGLDDLNQRIAQGAAAAALGAGLR